MSNLFRRVSSPTQAVQPMCTDDPFIIVDHPPNRNTLLERKLAQSTTSIQLDLGIFGGSRRVFTVYNDSQANLLLRFNNPASLTTWFYKIPPQGMWEMPLGWGNFSGAIHGIWDAAGSGFARVLEIF